MRHQKKGKILNRKKQPREAMLKNMAVSLIIYEKIKTTEAKAKIVKPQVERLVTKGRTNDLATRRYLMRHLPLNNAVKKVLEVLGPKYQDRRGGYLRIIKLNPRAGDGAKMAQIEFV
ncbi:MAG: 50S ribosomal protein L17 [bacterium]